MNGNDLRKEFGDYQTPNEFTEIVCKLLRDVLKEDPHVIVEPTSGLGNFLSASLNSFHNVENAYGLEINKEYCAICSKRISDKRLQVINDNFFDYDVDEFIDDRQLLFIGNPPWATNSELNFNLPKKENIKRLTGTDAITGASNFDICEYIIFKLLKKSVGKNVSIAMLCKTSVARNILQEIDRNSISVDCVKMFNFNASKVFGISASACLLYIKLSESGNYVRSCGIYDIDAPEELKSEVLFENGKLRTNSENIVDLEGNCSIEWRQGVKHDCAKVMELSYSKEDLFVNKNKETVSLEHTLVFPLMKSSSFKKPIVKSSFQKFVIVTQKKTREETAYRRELAPLTWKYLQKNKDLFEARKSSIYNGAPDFSMFGVGDYSYAPYKVGISGFYKKPLFSLIYNESEISHSVMVDDTSYFLSFDNYNDAYTCMLLLNSEKVQQFLLSISFKDSKRPYTKKVLQRLDINKCTKNVSVRDLLNTEQKLGLAKYTSDEIYQHFKKSVA